MEKKYDVCGIGNALVDYEIEVQDQFFIENGVEKGLMTLVDEDRQNELIRKSKEKIRNRQGGGSGANSIFGLTQLGGKGFYICRVANDEDGKFYINSLTDEGVGSSLKIKNLPDGHTGKCLIMITPDAERTMNTFIGISGDLSKQDVDEEAIKASRYIFLEGFPVSSPSGLEAMIYAKQIAEANGVKVAMTFSDPAMVKYFNDEIKEVVGTGVDLLFCNIEEAELFTGKTGIEEVALSLKKVARHFVVTMSEHGAIAFDGNEQVKIEPVPVKAVDSTGAGDMFAGAYLYGIISGMDLATAGKLASTASSAVVAKYGPRLSQSAMDEIRKSVIK